MKSLKCEREAMASWWAYVFDIITAIDGTSIKGMDDLITYLVRHTRPEQEVVLTVHRDGERKVEIPIVLGSR